MTNDAASMRSTLKPAVFLDRDGTIIEDRGHLRMPSEVVFYPDTVRALVTLQEHFLLFIVTHQPGVSYGLVCADEVEQVNAHVVAELRRYGVVITGVYYCPHRREEQCACIKPRPFFLEKAAGEFGLNLARSFVVGDHPHDVALADNAGATGIYVLTGHGARHRTELRPQTTVVPGIREAADWILASREMQKREDGHPGTLDRAVGRDPSVCRPSPFGCAGSRQDRGGYGARDGIGLGHHGPPQKGVGEVGHRVELRCWMCEQ